MNRIPKRKMKKGRHRTIEELAFKHVYANNFDHYIIGVREFGRTKMLQAIHNARETIRMVDPDHFDQKPISL